MEEEFGTLQIRVYTSRAQLPHRGRHCCGDPDQPTGKYHLLSVQITDREGRVQPLTILRPPAGRAPVPPRTWSPFSVCQVWAEHPGYTALRVDGVQIFSGEETDQDMELIPWPRGSTVLLTAPS